MVLVKITGKPTYDTCLSQSVSQGLASYLWCHIWVMPPGFHICAVFSLKMYFERTPPLRGLSHRSCWWSSYKLIAIVNGTCYLFSSVCHMSCSTIPRQETSATCHADRLTFFKGHEYVKLHIRCTNMLSLSKVSDPESVLKRTSETVFSSSGSIKDVFFNYYT